MCSIVGEGLSCAFHDLGSSLVGVRGFQCAVDGAGGRGLVSAILAIYDEAVTWVEAFNGGGDSFVELLWDCLLGRC